MKYLHELKMLFWTMASSDGLSWLMMLVGLVALLFGWDLLFKIMYFILLCELIMVQVNGLRRKRK